MKIRLSVNLACCVAALLWCAGASFAEAPSLASLGKDIDRASAAKDKEAAAKHLKRAQSKARRLASDGEDTEASLYEPLRATLSESLRAKSQPDRRELALRAKSQVDSLEAALTLPDADPSAQGRVSVKLAEVLARREFQRNGAMDSVMAWMAERAARVLRWLQEHVNLDLSAGGSVMKVIAWVVGIAAICLAAYLVANALSSLFAGMRAVETGRAPRRPDSAALNPRLARQDLLDAASRHAAEGQFREALRCLYQAMILTLHLARVLDYDANRTNREYAAAIRASGDEPLAAAFGEATALFERKWYGLQPAAQLDVDKMEEFLGVASSASAS